MGTGTRTASRTVSEDTVQLYRRQGFVHVPGVLDEREVARYAAAADELLVDHMELWNGEHGVEVNYVAQAWRKHDALRELALHPVIGSIALRLAGGPLRLYTTEVLAKEPHKAAPTLVHDDETGLPLDSLSRTLTAWVALSDVPVERGCLSYLPGSHLRGPEHRQEHMTSFEEFTTIARLWPDFAWQPRVTVPLRAGDVAFHHCRTVHMAGANTTDVRRLGHGIVYANAEATYRPGVQDKHMAGFTPGQPLSGDDFPLIEPAG
jgi:phytanoyl-CoA hydroxylase